MFNKTKRLLVGMTAVAALSLGASAISSAASSSSSGDGTTSTSSTRPAPPAFHGPTPGTASHEDAEKAVSGSAATKAKAAAVKALGGGKPGAVTTDYSGDGYEVTVTKSDGSKIEVHLNRSFQAVRGPQGPGCPPPPSSGA